MVTKTGLGKQTLSARVTDGCRDVIVTSVSFASGL